MIFTEDRFSLKLAVFLLGLLILFGVVSGCKPDRTPSSSQAASSRPLSSAVVSASSAAASSSSRPAVSSRPPAVSSGASSSRSSSTPSSSAPPPSSAASSAVSSQPPVTAPEKKTQSRLYNIPAQLNLTVTYFDYSKMTNPAVEKHPVVIFFHGGNWENGGLFKEGQYTELGPNLLYAKDEFLKKGYAVASCQYLRKTGGNKFPGPIKDAADAVRYIKDNAQSMNIDPSRIILAGKGAGAHTALMAAFRGVEYSSLGKSDFPVISAVIAYSALTDLPDLMSGSGNQAALRAFVEDYIGTAFAQDPTPYEQASPALRLHKDIPDCLLYISTQEAEPYGSQWTRLDDKYTELSKSLGAGEKIRGDLIKRTGDGTPEDFFKKCSEIFIMDQPDGGA